MTEARYDLFRRTVAGRTRYLTVLAENMYHGQNAAALIRHCEAFGVQRMHTVEALCRFEPNTAIARGTEQWVDVVRHRSTADALAALKSEGYRIVATTPHRGDHTPETFDVAAGPPAPGLRAGAPGGCGGGGAGGRPVLRPPPVSVFGARPLPAGTVTHRGRPGPISVP